MRLLAPLLSFSLPFVLTFFSLPALSGYNSQFDLPYGNHPLQRLDVFTPDNFNPADPENVTIVYIHGGGWVGGTKRQGWRHGTYYANRNVTVVSPGYRLSPEYRHPAHVDDVVEVINLVRTAVQGRLYVAAHSAGAHLAALAIASKRVQVDGAFLLDAAAWDLVGVLPYWPALRQVFNGPDLADASPLRQLDGGNYPPAYIFQSMDFAASWWHEQGALAFLAATGGDIYNTPFDHLGVDTAFSTENSMIATVVADVLGID